MERLFMKVLKICCAAAAAVILLRELLVKKNLPELYSRIVLPLNIVYSIIIFAFCAICWYVNYEVAVSTVGESGKFFVNFTAIVFTMNGIRAVLEIWLRWRRERGTDEGRYTQ